MQEGGGGDGQVGSRQTICETIAEGICEITGFSKPSVTKESKALVEAKIIGRENLTKGGRNKRSKYWVIGYGSGPHPTELNSKASV